MYGGVAWGRCGVGEAWHGGGVAWGRRGVGEVWRIANVLIQAQTGCFQEQYVMDESFAEEISLANVSDITINVQQQQVLVLQRSHPPVTVWSINGTFLFAWSTKDIGYPHSITLNGSDPADATVWITGMYDHCVKEFTYHGDNTSEALVSVGNIQMVQVFIPLSLEG